MFLYLEGYISEIFLTSSLILGLQLSHAKVIVGSVVDLSCQ